MKMIIQLPLFLILLISTLSLQAQRPASSYGGGRPGGAPAIKGTIKGEITDAASGDVVEFATIVLLSADGSKQITGTITEADGSFKLTDVPASKYQLKASFIGYLEKIVADVETTPQKPDLDLGQIQLEADAIILDAVEVTGEASLIENRIDKLVYNADKDATNQGGDASDVLRKVPLLSVDLEGNVSLRGSSNLQILVNGRPSSIFASSVADALRSIPSDQIKTVEVITSPSARYDGEGSGGIINIITKKKEAQGFTGTVNSSIGTRQNNGGLNLNALLGRFGLNGGLNGRWSWPRDSDIEFNRTDLDNGSPIRQLTQEGVNESTYLSLNGNVGAFYDFNAYNSLNLSGRYNSRRSGREGITNGNIDNFGSADLIDFSRFNDGFTSGSGFDGTLDYRKTFPNQKDKELIFAFQLSGQESLTENLVDQTGNLPIYQRDIINENEGLNLEYTGQVDYVHPFSKKVKMETGVKAVLRRIDSDYFTQVKETDEAEFVSDSRLTDLFLYDQDVYAGYVSFNVSLGDKWGLIAGTRYEVTEIGGDFRSENPSFNNSYQNLLPSIILNRKLSQFSNIKASYNQRIQRPSLFFINPFTSISDPNTLTIGNPSLEPERVRQYEVAYNTYIKGVVLNGAVYLRQTNDLIENFLELSDDGIASTTSYLNIGSSDTYGANIFTSFTVWKKLNLRGSFNYGRYNGTGFAGGEALTRSADVISGNVGGSFTFSKKVRLDLFSFFRNRNQSLQGATASFSIISVGANWNVSERTTLGIRVIEPWNEDKFFISEISGPNFNQLSSFSIPFRSVGLNLSYKFGEIDFKSQNRRSRVKNDDQKSGEGGGNF
ncbi:MAG: ferric enterobactin receptor [Neolewinella sp.]|jgi:outer membrane receptor protein involved in Fe transport